MVALGVALVALIALSFFGPHEPPGADIDPLLPTSSTGEGSRDENLTANPVAQGARVVAPSQRGDTAAEPTTVSPLLPNQVPATPIADALTARGMPAMPELLETERAFAAEPSDPAWSTVTEAQVLARIAEIPGLELASVDVECRRTLCRLQLVSPGPVPNGPPGAIVFPARDRPAPPAPGIAEIARATGLKSRWAVGFSPVSMAYLERGENADAPSAAP